jgi:PPOX class probable F420-dependent enzyme
VDTDEARAFIRANHRAVLATTRRDGRPQLSPMTVGLDAAGRVVMSTRETALKVRNLRREPYASVAVLTDGFFGEFVQVEGPVEIVALPDAMDLLIAYYRDISGEHPNWDEYRAAMIEQQRVLVRLRIDRVGPNASG